MMRSNQLEWTEGYKYRTNKTYWCFTNIRPYAEIQLGRITLTVEGLMIIDRHYSWDGPSGPTIDTKNFMPGSVVHDAGYELLRCPNKLLDRMCDIIRDGVTIYAATHEQVREEFDRLLQEIILADGMWQFRANYVFAAVRRGGVESAEKPRKVHTAP
jgi:hypothetical protein